MSTTSIGNSNALSMEMINSGKGNNYNSSDDEKYAKDDKRQASKSTGLSRSGFEN